MAANSSIILTELDFANLKESLKASMKAQNLFRDYDFDGSNINVLLDVLAYNTYQNAFYLNMTGSEMWLDSAQLRDSAVSHAKELNYIPRSFVSAEATVNLTITPTDTSQATILIPKGSTFTGRNGPDSFSFTVDKNTLAYREGSVYVANDVILYEGSYVTESFIVDNSREVASYRITNKNVDIRSLTVSSIEDNGANIIEYVKATSLFGLTEASRVFFVQPAMSDFYEVIFGDGVTGRQPKDNSVILIEYRTSKGELPNGINNFKLDSTLIGVTSVAVEVTQPAAGGAISESIESIKFNAPRAFTTQERAVTAEDYENLLRMNFPEVNVVAAYGGEEADPPQYGKVVLSVDIQGFDGLPKAKEETYRRFLKERAPLSIDPIFIQPEFIYLAVESLVRYNINLTGLTQSDITSLVVSAILNYKTVELSDFKTTGRYSKIVAAIDDSHNSIVSNETQILAAKYIRPSLGRNVTYDINFYQAITQPTVPMAESVANYKSAAVYSNAFASSNKTCYIMDDGVGNLRLVSINEQGKYVKLKNIGTIDYATGRLQISSLLITQMLDSASLKMYAKTTLKDITSTKNVILTINEEDIAVSVEQIRE
jgi:hypothetical protein